MKQSISGTNNKRGRPRTTGVGTQTGIRLLPRLVDAIDSWAAAQEARPTRTDAIRIILTEYLQRRGFYKNN
jgi:hypothetical protein